MIQEAYVSFEVAKLLKEKGFNWITQYVYTLDGTGSIPHKIGNWRAKSNIQKPTHQMAMAWLRQKGIFIRIIETVDGESFHYEVYCKKNFFGINYHIDRHYENSYEEAVEAALKYVLENLI